MFIESSPRAIKLSPEPGDFVFLNNRVVLHARNAFELNGGVRHFQNMFIGALEFRRQLAKIAVKIGNCLLSIAFEGQDQQTMQFCKLPYNAVCIRWSSGIIN